MVSQLHDSQTAPQCVTADCACIVGTMGCHAHAKHAGLCCLCPDGLWTARLALDVWLVTWALPGCSCACRLPCLAHSWRQPRASMWRQQSLLMMPRTAALLCVMGQCRTLWVGKRCAAHRDIVI